MKDLKRNFKPQFASNGVTALARVRVALDFLHNDTQRSIHDKVAGDYDYSELIGTLICAEAALSQEPQPTDDENFDPYSMVPEPDIYWCVHCNRTYRSGQFRRVGKRDLCPYDDCDGSTFKDVMDWESIRQHHSDYPAVPKPNECYPL